MSELTFYTIAVLLAAAIYGYGLKLESIEARKRIERLNRNNREIILTAANRERLKILMMMPDKSLEPEQIEILKAKGCQAFNIWFR